MKLTHMEEILIRANWIRDNIQSENKPVHITNIPNYFITKIPVKPLAIN
jgi:hypothetical protein